MRRVTHESLLLLGAVAVIGLAVLFTIILPAITSLGHLLQAGLARI